MPEPASPPRPDDLDTLNALVGTWDVFGDTSGTVRYEWMEGGFFLLQHVDLEESGNRTTGLEVIGHLRPYQGEPSPEIRSRYYGSGGDTLDYTYQVDGRVLTIWFGDPGSPAYYRGEFSEDGNECYGRWTYPGGGGYESNMRRANG
jgi:hypothetical protein